MKHKTIIALILTVILTVGGCMTAFATEDVSGNETSVGTDVGQVNKKITRVILPTDTNGKLNYKYDPQGLIKAAAKLADNSTTVTGNDEGIYFLKRTSVSDNGEVVDDGDQSYASTSDALKFVGRNSVNVDVRVKVEVTVSNNSIELAGSEEELNKMTDKPALLMEVDLGGAKKAVTKDGFEIAATIAGMPDNFEVTATGTGFSYAPKNAVSENDSAWDSTYIRLSGKTNGVSGDANKTIPTVKYTWRIEETPNPAPIWSGSTAYFSKNGTDGFVKAKIGAVEYSVDGTSYQTLATGKYNIGDDGWVNIYYNDIPKISDADAQYVRITVGKVKYVYKLF